MRCFVEIYVLFKYQMKLNKTSFDYTKDFNCRSFCILCDIMHASCFIQQNVEKAKQNSKKQKFENGLLRRNIRSFQISNETEQDFI